MRYISSKWLKEPFDVYLRNPSLTAQIEHAFQGNYSFSHAPPRNLRGFDLYHQISHSQGKHNSRARFKSLSPQQLNELQSSNELDKLYQETLRVWKGYEVVEYVKSHLPEHAWNPFQLSELYPREIIKDKLRIINNKTKSAIFKADIYDVLIDEAFGRDWNRGPKSVFSADVCQNSPGLSQAQFERMFKKLKPHQLHFYEEQIEKRKHHGVVKKAALDKAGFYGFYYKHVKEHSLFEIATEWMSMDKQQRKQWQLPKAITSTTNYYEKMLDLKTEVVLHYIIEIGVSRPEEYQELIQRQQMLSQFQYLNKIYTESIHPSWDYNNA